jgi:hypothetical protein
MFVNLFLWNSQPTLQTVLIVRLPWRLQNHCDLDLEWNLSLWHLYKCAQASLQSPGNSRKKKSGAKQGLMEVSVLSNVVLR